MMMMMMMIIVLTMMMMTRNKAGQCIGAVGVSGGSVDQDVEVARAAAEAVAQL